MDDIRSGAGSFFGHDLRAALRLKSGIAAGGPCEPEHLFESRRNAREVRCESCATGLIVSIGGDKRRRYDVTRRAPNVNRDTARKVQSIRPSTNERVIPPTEDGRASTRASGNKSNIPELRAATFALESHPAHTEPKRGEKRMKHHALLGPALISFFVLFAGPAFAQVQQTTLFKAPGAANSTALSLCSVNNRGTVASFAVIDGVFKPYVMKNSEFEFLQTLPSYDGTFAPALNNRGDVVALSYRPGGAFMERIGTLWRGGGLPEPLPVPAPSVYGNAIYFEPIAINAKGVIIGQSTEELAPQVWGSRQLILRDGVFSDVPSPAVSPPQLIDINDSDDILVQVFGTFVDGFLGYRFYILRNGSYTHVEIPDAHQVRALNNLGHILASDINEDYIYFADGESTVFPKLLGAQNTYLRSLTNDGRTCGSAVSYNVLQQIMTNNFLLQLR
jgi:hypothetical protein